MPSATLLLCTIINLSPRAPSLFFPLSFQIPKRYPFEPPGIKFTTPIYHPNVDSAGKPCLLLIGLTNCMCGCVYITLCLYAVLIVVCSPSFSFTNIHELLGRTRPDLFGPAENVRLLHFPPLHHRPTHRLLFTIYADLPAEFKSDC